MSSWTVVCYFSRLKIFAMFLVVFLILDIMFLNRLRFVVDELVVSSSSYVVMEMVNISDEAESLGVEVLVHFNICFRVGVIVSWRLEKGLS